MIVSILCSSTATTAVRLDSGWILRRLVRTGKVSARTHLVSTRSDERSNNSSFALLLRGLESVRGEKLRCYTPFDFAHDMLSKCSDVSERQMVLMLHYMVTNAAPKDVATYFYQNKKKIDAGHPFKTKMARFAALETKSNFNSAEEKEELIVLGRMLILFGTATLMQNILQYSSCNESLLRAALDAELSRNELGLLIRFFVELLNSPERFCPLQKNACGRVVQWLSALCDCLRPPLVGDEARNLSLIQSALAAEVSKTEAIVSLQEHINEAEAVVLSDSNTMTKPTESRDNTVKKQNKSAGGLPPYQIERLVF